MKIISRPLWIGVFLLVLLSSSCNLPVQTAAPVGTVIPNEATQPALATSTELTSSGISTPLTPIIPITGENVVEMQCQFCVNDLPHAVLIFPAFAIFDVDTTATSPVTCLTAEVLNGKRVLVCSGTQLTTFNLKICSDESNCLLFPVTLQGCPLAGTPGAITGTVTPMSPVFLKPINTLKPPKGSNATPSPLTSPTSAVLDTPTPTGILPPLSTPTGLPLLTPTPILPTSTEPPPPAPTDTVEPTQASTSAPEATATPNSSGNKKDTKTPKP
jgi:hypothetical protein